MKGPKETLYEMLVASASKSKKNIKKTQQKKGKGK